MIKEYEIDYSEQIPKLKIINKYDFNEDIADIGMIALFFMECLKVDEEPIEHIFVIAYDSKDKLVGVCKVADGDLGSVNLDNKKIITFLILSGGTQFLVEHNHPDGSSTPSQGDKFADGALKALAMMFNFHYLGGLIVAKGEYSVINGQENVEI